MIYDFECQSCEHRFEVASSIADRDKPRACPACESMDTKHVVSLPRHNLPGDDWPSKNNRIKGQMAAKNERLNRKQDEQKHDAPVAKLVPNVEGEQTDSWSDAQKLAKDKGKDSKSFEPMVRKEKAGQL